jgi:hypothetical protein
MYSHLHFYLDLDWELYLDDPINYLKKTHQIVSFVYQHKATVFYRKEQIKQFIEACEADKKYIDSLGDKLDLIIKNARDKNEGNYLFELNFAQENTTINHEKNLAISSIEAHDKLALLSLSGITNNKTYLIAKSNDNFERVHLHIFDNVSGILNWISTSKPRKFNKSSKHGENGTGNWSSASKLKCFEKEAQILLDGAIPDFTIIENRLFNFDEVHKTFIEFYCEGINPKNQWHGFHIEQKDWKRVPNSILKFFNKKLT